MKAVREKFAELDGRTVSIFTLVNRQGMEVSCLDYGCIITKILVPDRDGRMENVVLGFDTLEEYQQHSPYFGAVCGRHAGRIAGGEFELNGKTYKLAKNNGGNNLHGGVEGFDKKLWDAEMSERPGSASVIFRYVSRDGEEGYPGNLEMQVTYTLNDRNELEISYEGISDQDTVVNLTNHSYFNLSGDLKRDILDHELILKSERFAELDEALLPTGELLSVNDTVFDFTEGRKVSEGKNSDDTQNIFAGSGYDHPFLLTENKNEEISLYDAESGRLLVVETDQPAVVVYTGNQLEENFSIRGIPSRNHLGMCLETQGLPDAVHHTNFPSSVLRKGERYQTSTKYTFRAEDRK
ncbi:aldose epimerase family protein [Bacillus sp. MMSF_3328]|uniref:aldose epimerase family protein n=1 Tax=Bacillus TaxID=1386 RepID=UPI00273EC8D6|nr:aldose epimerase family protein [Bacillus sp. MMSF_3328]